ncbi:MAG: CapA family protein [Clostridia bacterium]|nr:CapA family protein [Clostridia bacterium]
MRPGGKTFRRLATVIFAAACLAAGTANADRVITLSFTGDCTIGSEEARRTQEDSLHAYAEQNGYDYFFANFRELFEADDATIINLEGVLSDTANGEKTSKRYRFRGPADFTGILKAGSVEVAGLANNHTADFGARGMENTKKALEDAGIGWARAMDCHIVEKDSIRIAVFSMDYALSNTIGDRLRKKITEMEESGEVNATVVLFHNGNEYDPKHNSVQESRGKSFVEAGADLVVMHHSHVVQGLRILDNRSIFYSLGNFVFGGNREIKSVLYPRDGGREPTSLYCLVVQAKLYFDDDGNYTGQQMILYPGYTSSAAPVNNYQPQRISAEQAEPVLDAMQYDTPDTIMPAVGEDETGYARLVMPFLPSGREKDGKRSTDGLPEAPKAYPDRNNR